MWACPEVARLWFIRQLQQEGLVTRVVGRPALPGEDTQGTATSYPESHNLRAGLELARSVYGVDQTYVVAFASDVIVNPGTLTSIAQRMLEHEAVVFHWQNGVIHNDIWHTNCFAVSLDDRYWPPVSSAAHADTLERQWGLLLQQRQLPAISTWHNYNGRNFQHRHESESLPEFPRRAEQGSSSLGLVTRGWQPWWARLGVWLHNFSKRIRWPKY